MHCLFCRPERLDWLVGGYQRDAFSFVGLLPYWSAIRIVRGLVWFFLPGLFVGGSGRVVRLRVETALQRFQVALLPSCEPLTRVGLSISSYSLRVFYVVVLAISLLVVMCLHVVFVAQMFDHVHAH